MTASEISRILLAGDQRPAREAIPLGGLYVIISPRAHTMGWAVRTSMLVKS